jgi:RNA polymerase sigma-70 factor, ECF subfamily
LEEHVSLSLPVAHPRSTQHPSEQAMSFQHMVSPHYRSLRLLARHLTRSEAEADDLVQDTLERALRSFTSFELNASPRTWLSVIMRNLFLDRCRQKARLRWESDAALQQIATPIARRPELWRCIDIRQLEDAIDALEAELREVFLMRWQQQRSYKEIASLLGMPINTVATKLLRARRSIREHLVSKVNNDNRPDYYAGEELSLIAS